ncbi:hypothetical protein CI238_09215 [Colletotrichum incanum]|uniref:RING-type domain-containing protein n=1 Tax=Colletotrichum incanum TaxID=1573173 RepID=A0A162PA51_COLIC|nr:hypothetical protein CI238_09215 [Colletotrichum incanum]
MAPSNNNRPTVRCHPMKTRATSRREDSSCSEGSPENSPVETPMPRNSSRNRKRSGREFEELEASSSNKRPGKKPKVEEQRAPTPIDLEDDTDKVSSPWESENGSGCTFPPVETPSPALHVRSDGFWPTIRDDYLKSLEDGSIRVDIPCVICGDECIVAGQTHWGLRRPEGTGTELPVILCYGHMIGDGCLEKWNEARQEEEEPLNCPICRRDFQCTDCGCSLTGWLLTLDIPVGETKTIQEGGHQVPRCNACEAHHVFGKAIRAEDYVTEEYPGEPQPLLDWFHMLRSNAGAEARTGRHRHVAPGDIPELVLDNVFATMRLALEDFEYAVRSKVEDTLDGIERELDYVLPWNHPGSSEADEDDEDETSSLSIDSFW